MLNLPPLTLTTDFGPAGPYVAQLKGVILSRAPGARMIDVTHGIAPQNILEGAFMLASIIDSFPPDTVHLAVVDPGVGTNRKLVALRACDQWVVAPDNGLAGGILLKHQPQSMWEIKAESLPNPRLSNTFHGRDILAPAACHLLLGRDPALLGPPLRRMVQLANFEPRDTQNGLCGEVIFRDSFGNLVTNLSESLLRNRPAATWQFELGGQLINGLSNTYADRSHGELVAVIGSSGWLEVAVVNGDAGRQLGVGPGTTVWAHR
jgi:S-adenosylmethionine hydrolase